jgi:hypothetical protein
VKAVLDQAEKFDLYVLDPKGAATPKEEFHKYTVKRKVSIEDEVSRRRLTKVLDDLMHKPKSSRCFNPGFAIRATKMDQVVDLLICFDCGHIGIHLNGKDLGLTPMDADGEAIGTAAFEAVLKGR